MTTCKKCHKNKAEQASYYCYECNAKKEAAKKDYFEQTKGRYLSTEAIARKTRIVLRDHATCQRCKIQKPKEFLVVHHVIPIREGGMDDDNNLIVLCKHCHSVIHHRKGATLDVLFPGEAELLRERVEKASDSEPMQPPVQSGALPNFFFENGQMNSDTPGAFVIDDVLYIFGDEEVSE